jgi:hypothetical protein
VLTLSLIRVTLEDVRSTKFEDVGEFFFTVVLFADDSLLLFVADVQTGGVNLRYDCKKSLSLFNVGQAATLTGML